jgi:hypothetical protein
MQCASWGSLLACNLVSPCLGRKPKARVVTFCKSWWKKLINYMFCLDLQNVMQWLQALIYGWIKVLMIFLLNWLKRFEDLIDYWNILDYLTLQKHLDKCWLKIWKFCWINLVWKKKNIAYVKDENFNLNAMTFALKFVVSCETLGLQESFNGTYFGHVFIQNMSICYYWWKSVHKFKVCIYQSKSSRFAKVYDLAQKSCVETRIHRKKLNILVKSR